MKLNTVQDCLDYMKDHPRTGFEACLTILSDFSELDYISLNLKQGHGLECFNQSLLNNSEVLELLGLDIDHSIATCFMFECA